MKKFSFFSFYSLIAIICFYLIIFVFIVPNVHFPNNIPDKHFFYSSNELFSILSKYSAAETENYIKASLKFDIVFPFTNFLFFFILLTILYRKLYDKKNIPLFAYLAALGTILDYTENISILYLLKNIKNFSFKIASVAGYVTMCKWITYYILIIITIILTIIFVKNKIKSTKFQA
jgi:hypothetical protein